MTDSLLLQKRMGDLHRHDKINITASTLQTASVLIVVDYKVGYFIVEDNKAD